MFRERYNGRQQALFHVLAAYSIYNSEVGYCQGNKSKTCIMIKLASFFPEFPQPSVLQIHNLVFQECLRLQRYC